jgi:uncharacterized protein (DUF58 family)
MDKRAKKIILKSKKQVYSDRLGNNPSRFHGEGYEFSELREYLYGDDVRKIDWKSTAKLGKPFVKVYKEERELNIIVASMINGSTYFGTHKQKIEIIAQLVGLLGFLAIKNSDRFTNAIFADKLYELTKSSKKFFSVHQAVKSVVEFQPLGKEGDFAGMIDTLYRRIAKKSLLFLVSDFVGEMDLRVLAKKHDVVALIIRDRFEENPQELGLLNMIDMESQKSFEGMIDLSAVKRYKKALHDNDEKLYAHFKKHSIRFIKIYTDDAVAMRLARLFRR